VADEREDSRLRIEAAAREEFRQHGFDGARIDRIARLSGLNKQLIYYYFGSKRELYAHTIRQAANRVRIDPTLRRTLPGTPADRLRVLLMTMVDRVARAPEIARALLQREGDAETATDAGRLMSELAEELGQEISRGQGLGRQAVALLVGWGVLQGARGGQTDGDVTGWADATAGLLGRALAW
jgi:TetR/AcrR family transcriptional regulator